MTPDLWIFLLALAFLAGYLVGRGPDEDRRR